MCVSSETCASCAYLVIEQALLLKTVTRLQHLINTIIKWGGGGGRECAKKGRLIVN